MLRCLYPIQMLVIAFASYIVEAKHAALIRNVGQAILEDMSALCKWAAAASKSQSLRMRDDSKLAVHA